MTYKDILQDLNSMLPATTEDVCIALKKTLVLLSGLEDEKEDNITNPNKPTNVDCPNCGDKMIPRNDQFGKFWGCKNYPTCKGTRDTEGMSKEDRNKMKPQLMPNKRWSI